MSLFDRKTYAKPASRHSGLDPESRKSLKTPHSGRRRNDNTAVFVICCKCLRRVIFTAALLFVSAAPSVADIHGYLDVEGNWCFTRPDNTPDKYNHIIKQVAERFRVDKSLVTAVIKAESGFDHRAVSKKGAKGLMQIMPATASLMDLEEPFNPEENIAAGTRYLGMMLERFNENKTLALAAYNAGPEAVETYRGVPPFQETRDFVRRVLNYYKQYKRLGSL